MAIDKATMQEWQHGGIEAIRQAQEELRKLKEADNTGLSDEYEVLTEGQIQAYALARADDRVWDVELADGRQVSVNGDANTTEDEAIQKAKDYFDNL